MGKVKKVVKGLFGGPEVPKEPDPPPPPPEPAPLPDPEDELLQQRKRRQAAVKRQSGRASTILSEGDRQRLG